MNLIAEIALSTGWRCVALRDTYFDASARLTEAGDTRITEAGDSRITEDNLYYRGALKDELSITSSLPNLFYGVEEKSSLTITFADDLADSWHDIVAAEEVRGRPVIIRDVNREFVAYGRIESYELDLDVKLSIDLTNDSMFDTLLPKGVVTADIFDETAVNIGSPIPIVFGYAKNVPLPNICNDTTNDYYDYLIGYGVVESLHEDAAHGYGVKRDGVLVDTDEYTFYDGSQVAPYPGYAFIRFTVEQKDFGGNFHNLHADVYGLELGTGSASRNFGTVLAYLIENSTWGLGEIIDPTSFATATAELADLKCDGFIQEQRAARDILDDMLFAARSRIYRNVNGYWEIAVDGTGESVATFGDNDGYYNNCEIQSVSAEKASSAIKTARVRYDDERFEIYLNVHSTFGVEKVYSLPYVSDEATAKLILSYIYGRAYYADKTLRMLADSDAEDLSPGNVITITSARHGLSSATYRVTEITKGLSKYQVDCEAYSASIFADKSGDIASPTAQTNVLVVHDLQTIDSGYIGGMIITGTTISTADATNIILDAGNKAISINDATFGNAGIQLQYNAGTPRAYIGDGSNNFVQFDGTDLTGTFGGVANLWGNGGAFVTSGGNTQNINYGTETQVTLGTEVWDVNGDFASSTYTASEDGVLFVSAQIMTSSGTWNVDPGTELRIYVKKNATVMLEGYDLLQYVGTY